VKFPDAIEVLSGKKARRNIHQVYRTPRRKKGDKGGAGGKSEGRIAERSRVFLRRRDLPGGKTASSTSRVSSKGDIRGGVLTKNEFLFDCVAE